MRYGVCTPALSVKRTQAVRQGAHAPTQFWSCEPPGEVGPTCENRSTEPLMAAQYCVPSLYAANGVAGQALHAPVTNGRGAVGASQPVDYEMKCFLSSQVSCFKKCAGVSCSFAGRLPFARRHAVGAAASCQPPELFFQPPIAPRPPRRCASRPRSWSSSASWTTSCRSPWAARTRTRPPPSRSSRSPSSRHTPSEQQHVFGCIEAHSHTLQALVHYGEDQRLLKARMEIVSALWSM